MIFQIFNNSQNINNKKFHFSQNPNPSVELHRRGPIFANAQSEDEIATAIATAHRVHISDTQQRAPQIHRHQNATTTTAAASAFTRVPPRNAAHGPIRAALPGLQNDHNYLHPEIVSSTL